MARKKPNRNPYPDTPAPYRPNRKALGEKIPFRKLDDTHSPRVPAITGEAAAHYVKGEGEPTPAGLVPPLRILAAAIKCDKGMIHYQPAPARHHEIIEQMREDGYEGSVINQGFLLTNSKFANRAQAKMIARRAGQLIGGKTIAHVMTSEDLW